jgi:hypothetical protein
MKSFAAAVLLLSACASIPREMSLRTEPNAYSPAMSSTPGIGLTTVFVPPGETTVSYHWSTNFGYFVTWNAPDYKVKPLGADVVASEGTVYWTYDPTLTLVSKPVVTIEVEALDTETERVLAKAKVKLDWEKDTARVRD